MNRTGNGSDVAIARDLLRSYVPPPGYDEVIAPDGQLRAHWTSFAERLQELGHDDLVQRWSQAERLVRDSGIMYNPYGDPDASARPWDLDALPLLITEGEWQVISRGLVQRARLLNRVIGDLYGPQELLHKRLLPPELLFANPGFVRQFRDLPVAGKSHLHFYSADLVRGTDGQWWVMADRCDAPLGAGYAVENRLILSRTFPRFFQASRVERLASFFIALRERLQSLAPRHRDNPRVVLLSHGPKSTNYFEDIYLARYLGMTLAEGGDLAVRNAQVSLKTLGGLLPVDVIYRRVSELFIDPLELGSDAAVGCAGIIEAIRAGNVAVVNNLGCGLVESAAFMPFLPFLSKQLFGESLQLPAVATWWCGDPKARKYVSQAGSNLVLRGAFRAGRRSAVRETELPASVADTEAAWIDSHANQLVAQERTSRSTAPIWHGTGTRPGYVAMRVYLVSDGDSFSVMPGGLIEMADSSDKLDYSVLAGEGSKDVWILSSKPVHRVSLLGQSKQRITLQRSGTDIPSRVADNVFWLGRYLERSDGMARLLRTIFSKISGEWEAEVTPELVILLRVLAFQGTIEPGLAVDEFRPLMPQLDEALLASVFDEHTGSLRSTLGQLHRLASKVRDRLSVDSWHIINGIDRQLARSHDVARHDVSQMIDLLNHVIVELSAMVGMVGENMTRTLVWRFLDAGRRLERASYTISLIQNSLVEVAGDERVVLETITEVADCTMTYRSRYLTSWQTTAVLDLLLTDETNPRSLAYQLNSLTDHVAHLPRDPLQAVRDPEQRITMSIQNSVLLADPQELATNVKDGKRIELDRLLARLGNQLPKLSNLIAGKYLAHTSTPRMLGRDR